MNRPVSKLKWIAKLLDKWGSFGLLPGKIPAIHIVIWNDDKEAEEVSRTFNNLLLTHIKTNHWKEKVRFEVTVKGNAAVGWMFTLYPLLSEVRQKQIRRYIEIWKYADPEL